MGVCQNLLLSMLVGWPGWTPIYQLFLPGLQGFDPKPCGLSWVYEVKAFLATRCSESTIVTRFAPKKEIEVDLIARELKVVPVEKRSVFPDFPPELERWLKHGHLSWQMAQRWKNPTIQLLHGIPAEESTFEWMQCSCPVRLYFGSVWSVIMKDDAVQNHHERWSQSWKLHDWQTTDSSQLVTDFHRDFPRIYSFEVFIFECIFQMYLNVKFTRIFFGSTPNALQYTKMEHPLFVDHFTGKAMSFLFILSSIFN